MRQSHLRLSLGLMANLQRAWTMGGSLQRSLALSLRRLYTSLQYSIIVSFFSRLFSRKQASGMSFSLMKWQTSNWSPGLTLMRTTRMRASPLGRREQNQLLLLKSGMKSTETQRLISYSCQKLPFPLNSFSLSSRKRYSRASSCFSSSSSFSSWLGKILITISFSTKAKTSGRSFSVSETPWKRASFCTLQSMPMQWMPPEQLRQLTTCRLMESRWSVSSRGMRRFVRGGSPRLKFCVSASTCRRKPSFSKCRLQQKPTSCFSRFFTMPLCASSTCSRSHVNTHSSKQLAGSSRASSFATNSFRLFPLAYGWLSLLLSSKRVSSRSMTSWRAFSGPKSRQVRLASSFSTRGRKQSRQGLRFGRYLRKESWAQAKRMATLRSISSLRFCWYCSCAPLSSRSRQFSLCSATTRATWSPSVMRCVIYLKAAIAPSALLPVLPISCRRFSRNYSACLQLLHSRFITQYQYKYK